MVTVKKILKGMLVLHVLFGVSILIVKAMDWFGSMVDRDPYLMTYMFMIAMGVSFVLCAWLSFKLKLPEWFNR